LYSAIAGKTLYSKALGKLNYESDSPPFTTDSVCWIASMTKLLTAVSVMQLVEKEKIGLGDDLGNLIPQLSEVEILKGFEDDGKPIMEKKTKPITLRYSSRAQVSRYVLTNCSNLLTHSSGFAYDAANSDLMKWATAMGRTENCMTHSLEGFTFPLKFQPGDGWVYGVGIDWAAHVVETISGVTFEEYMEEHIFKPLGMSSTTFRMPKRPDLAERRAPIGYRAAPGGPLGAGPTPIPDSPSMPSGGAGVYSTADDYAKVLVALLTDGGGLLMPESVQQLRDPQLPDSKYLMAEFHGSWHAAICPEYPIGIQANYGLGGALNLEDLPQKRRKGSMMWSGMANTHWVCSSKSLIS
jgi:CubicO group peptidase (beta-lactamase class C family)